MADLTSDFCAEFEQAFKDGKKLPPKAALDLCMEVIWRHKHAYTFEGPCENFLTHPENRSRLMLSARNAHKHAENIHLSGADLDQLKNALCFELAKDPAKRALQLRKNAELIKRAAGLLADINGAERFITVGCGHTAAICKHAKAGGRTSSKLLQDVNGYLDVSKLMRDPKFKLMIEKGWKWTCIKADVDFKYPDFAKLAQRACNSSNSNRQHSSESEIICQLSDYHSQALDEGVTDAKAVALDALQDQSRVATYAYTLFEYALKYGGGPDVPWIRFLDAFGKEYGTTKAFGETFWDKISNMKFPQNKQGIIEHFPLMRLALLTVQSVHEKQKDDIATFLTVADLKKIVVKSKLEQARELEEVITTAFQFTEIIDGEFLVTYQKVVGQLLVRAGLMIVEKELKGHEGKKYTIPELKTAYLADISAATGKVVTYAPWTGVAKPSEAVAAGSDVPEAAAKPSSDFKDLSAYTSIEGQAKELGYAVGDVVVEKGNEDAPNMWTIVEMLAGETIILQRIFSYTGEVPDQKFKLDINTLKTRWKTLKEPVMPCKISACQIRPDSLTVDCVRADAYKALIAADKAATKKDDQGIAFWADPTSVRTTRKLKAGELTLLPLVPIGMIYTKNNTSGTAMQICDDPIELFIHPLPKQVHLKKDEHELKNDQLAAAYWTVVASHTSQADDANMQETTISKNGFEFKALTNESEIQPYTQLQVYKAPEPKAVAGKLMGVSIYNPADKRRRLTGTSS